MDFTLPDHVEALREEVRKFAEKEIRPKVMQWDEAKTFPMAVMKQLGEMGMMGVIFPEAYGGAGMGYIEYAVVVEELSRVDGSVGISIAAHNSLCSNHIYAMGSEAQKQKYLVPLASGKATRLCFTKRLAANRTAARNMRPRKTNTRPASCIACPINCGSAMAT